MYKNLLDDMHNPNLDRNIYARKKDVPVPPEDVVSGYPLLTFVETNMTTKIAPSAYKRLDIYAIIPKIQIDELDLTGTDIVPYCFIFKDMFSQKFAQLCIPVLNFQFAYGRKKVYFDKHFLVENYDPTRYDTPIKRKNYLHHFNAYYNISDKDKLDLKKKSDILRPCYESVSSNPLDLCKNASVYRNYSCATCTGYKNYDKVLLYRKRSIENKKKAQYNKAEPHVNDIDNC